MSGQSPIYFFAINATDLERLSRRYLYFARRRLVALYSIVDGKICPAKQLQYFREPELSEYPLDLNDTFQTYRFFKLSTRTRALLTLQHEITLSSAQNANNGGCIDRIERTYVYTRRETLKYLMEFCYAIKGDRRILVSRYGGKLYLFEIIGELRDDKRTPVHTHHNRLGRQLFVDEPNGLPNLDRPFDICDMKHGVHRSTLGKFDITYSGGVKGIISDAKLDNINDMDAVNRERFAISKQMWHTLKNHHIRLLSYWIELYLANVEDLYLAYKDENGIVQEPIEHIKVSSIPKNRPWKPVVCTAFLNHFLQLVEQLMTNVDSFETVYEFHFTANDKKIHYEIHTGNPEKIVIPKEYIEFAKNQGC